MMGERVRISECNEHHDGGKYRTPLYCGRMEGHLFQTVMREDSPEPKTLRFGPEGLVAGN